LRLFDGPAARRSALLVVGPLVLSGCLHRNVIRNANALYAEAETARWAGSDSLAAGHYQDVVQKTGEALRAQPESDWADPALLLLGQARLRLGEFREARAALTEVSTRTADPTVRAEADVYLAVLSAEIGERALALRLVNEVLDVPLEDEALADAHLLRGRLFLQGGRPEEAWWDLDRAVDANPEVRVEAGVERLTWAVRGSDVDASRRAVDGLLADPDAGARIDTVAALIRAAGVEWGPTVAADLLSGADQASWHRAARGGIVLERARYLHLAGDMAAATDEALRIARGLGTAATEGRLLLADWQSARARDVAEVYALRALLLPAGSDPVVMDRLGAIDALEAYVESGLDEPLAWFAAAEVARDRLGADYLARGLFLAYADGSPTDPWAPKSLLAALEISLDEGDRAWLRGRLEAHADSPYVLAAHGGSSAGFQALEEELELRLKELTHQ